MGVTVCTMYMYTQVHCTPIVAMHVNLNVLSLHNMHFFVIVLLHDSVYTHYFVHNYCVRTL